MTIAEFVKSLLITTLLASANSHAADEEPIVIALEEGKLIAYFNLGKSRCVLRNDQIRCVIVDIK